MTPASTQALLNAFDPSVYASLLFLFGIAAQFRAMDGYTLLRRMLSRLGSKLGVVYAVALVTTVFSPFILNDVLILILTPVLVRISREGGINIAPLVVAEVTYTNISSALTPIGNPQNILLWVHSGLPASKFVELTWRPLFLSGILTALAVYPASRSVGRPQITVGGDLDLKPAVYLSTVAALTFSLNLARIPSVVSLAISFAIGFAFTSRRLKHFRRELDVKSLLILYLLITTVSLASIFLQGALKPYVEPAALGEQPYSAAFMLGVSNIISNVPATQLLLTVGNVAPLVAPKIAVEAGLAGNLDPIGSLANLLALNIMRQGGLTVKRTIMLQLVVGAISFLPALLA
jgi:Na+/H+ antiporter NhaD/arsenite permease-like protein